MAFDPLNDVIVVYSVSSVTLSVSLSQNICSRPSASAAIAQEEQLLLSLESLELIGLGDGVMVLELKDVVLTNDQVDVTAADHRELGMLKSFKQLHSLPVWACENARKTSIEKP